MDDKQKFELELAKAKLTGHMPTEKSIEKAIRKKLTDMGCLVRKRHGGGYGTLAGEPDLYGCYKGRAFVIEVKRPGEKPTKLQCVRLREWKEAGAIAIVASSVNEVMAWLSPMFGFTHD